MKNNKVIGRGRPINYSDEELKKIALEVKHQHKGKELTFLFLQKETGIGRHTWKRRIPDVLEELNKPVPRKIGLTNSDEVYFPNIEELFEKHGDNRQRIIAELQQYEQLFYEVFNEMEKYRNKLETYRNIEKTISQQREELVRVRKLAEHYEHLYKSVTVSSTFPHLQSKVNVNRNLLEFKNEMNKNANLTNLESFFPKVDDRDEFVHTRTDSTDSSTDTMEKLEKMFPNILKNKKTSEENNNE
ncbi:hypothetical protein ACQKK5_11100 [Brevibacillus panacihumi]|uniref:hypothetical protein n=1 Tax=Brevibacillus panacihumi TaxID=497735 RepID=UPI003CFE53D8